MSTHRSSRVDRDTAEQLLAGHGVGPVASVLRAAAAPAHREELAGEDAAVAAFRTAEVAAAPRRTSAFRSVLAKVVTVKAAIVLAAAASTGIVLAATGGALPVPWSDSPADPPVTTTTGDTATTTTTTTRVPNPPAGGTSDGRQPPATPDPSIVGLCRAYAAPENKGEGLDSPAFHALVEAAGGKNEVAEYCDDVEAAAPGTPEDPAKERDHEPGKRSDGDDNGDDNGGDNGDDSGDHRDDGDRPGPPAPPEPAKPGKPGKTAPTTDTEPTSEPTDENAVTKTPDSPALGAASAVPPSGAEPPSKGG